MLPRSILKCGTVVLFVWLCFLGTLILPLSIEAVADESCQCSDYDVPLDWYAYGHWPMFDVRDTKTFEAAVSDKKLGAIELCGPGIFGNCLSKLAGRKGIKAIKICDTKLSDADLEYLSSLPDLEHVYLTNNQLVSEVCIKNFSRIDGLKTLYCRLSPGVVHLSSKKNESLGDLSFRNLTDLSLMGPAISNETLSSIKSLPKLRALRLEHTSITDSGWRALKRLTPANLSRISVVSMPMSAVAFDVIGKIPALKSLTLRHVEANDESFAGLLNARDLEDFAFDQSDSYGTWSYTVSGSLSYLKYLRNSKITHLDVEESKTQKSRQQFEYLAMLLTLERLSLRETTISNKDLCQLSNLTHLQYLDLSNTKVSDQGIRCLATMSQLRNLNLSATRISDRALDYVCLLPKLESLDISHTAVTDMGLSRLEQMNSLNDVNIHWTKTTRKGQDGVIAAMPGCYINIGESMCDTGPPHKLVLVILVIVGFVDALILALLELANYRIVPKGRPQYLAVSGLLAFASLSVYAYILVSIARDGILDSVKTAAIVIPPMIFGVISVDLKNYFLRGLNTCKQRPGYVVLLSIVYAGSVLVWGLTIGFACYMAQNGELINPYSHGIFNSLL